VGVLKEPKLACSTLRRDLYGLLWLRRQRDDALLQLHLASWPKQQSHGPPGKANPAGGLSIQIVKALGGRGSRRAIAPEVLPP